MGRNRRIGGQEMDAYPLCSFLAENWQSLALAVDSKDV
jgi:hypothetical protein